LIKIGNFIFSHRNVIFLFFFAIFVLGTRPAAGSDHLEIWRYALGFSVVLAGQIIRALTIGLAYIVRGGRNRKVYAKELVKNGIFAHCRNPLYLGNILIIIGLGIVAHSILFYVLGIPLFIFMYVAIIRAEEDYLANKFGEEYIEYCRSVNRFIPRMSGIRKTIKGMKFNWRRLIVKEYGATYLWMICIISLIIKNQYFQYDYKVSKTVLLTLSVSFFVVTLLYAVARYLKKSKRLRAD
jgi:protein-S-isoprenylcysteine O-methyltransferase Ste14